MLDECEGAERDIPPCRRGRDENGEDLGSLCSPWGRVTFDIALPIEPTRNPNRSNNNPHN